MPRTANAGAYLRLWATYARGLIQMRAFESIKFTAFPKSARNFHRSRRRFNGIRSLMAINDFIARIDDTAEEIDFTLIH